MQKNTNKIEQPPLLVTSSELFQELELYPSKFLIPAGGGGGGGGIVLSNG